MRHGPHSDAPPNPVNWRIMASLVPYLLEFRGRVLVALGLLIAAKVATVAVPWVLKQLVDGLAQTPLLPLYSLMALVLGYGALRFGSVFFGELRDALFARVAERAMRRVTLRVFSHLHALDLRFHLNRKTGALARDIERGTSGISFLLRFMLFNILPTLLEITLVALILGSQFRWPYLTCVVAAVVFYALFSVVVTEWRNRFIRAANDQDNRTNTRAMDSLLNYETVKYFNNETYEIQEYDKHLEQWETARLKNRLSLFFLNAGQAFIIALAITTMMLLATHEVAANTMTLGELVMINAYMIQLFIPLNFLGFVYREIRQSLINIERLFGLLDETPQHPEPANAPALQLQAGHIEFKNIHFGYTPERPILQGVNLRIQAGQTLAIVGPSGAGKSTLARLLFRFYTPNEGGIFIDGQNIAEVTAASLRQHIGVVPQDTVLFNDTLYYNLAYANPQATAEAIQAAAHLAHLTPFIEQLPEGYNTLVGERGLKVSGGEKQRIAIARVLLKNPSLLIFDEATSALDSTAEKAILSALKTLAKKHTTLVIAHRLSTIMDADTIAVLEKGRIVEQGTHSQLLQLGGAYAQLWAHQQQEA